MWLTYFWQILGQQVIYKTLNSCNHQKSLFGKDSSKAVVHIARQFELLLAASSDFQISDMIIRIRKSSLVQEKKFHKSFQQNNIGF